jgi:helicase
MDLKELIRFGIPENIISSWESGGIQDLTELQEACFQNQEMLRGRNTLVIAPTSAGKTFVGEVLAVRAALELKRVIYVVPFKALAEEKYRRFSETYREAGISVAVSSGDRNEFDEDIRRGRYLITVVVNEKLSQLLVESPGILADCGLVVFDEIQLIRDINRGPRLEMLVTRILLSAHPPQVIALSATVGALNQFDEWLQCAVIESTSRPVPLEEFAVMSDGRLLRYDSQNHRVVDAGHFDRVGGLVDLVSYLVEQGQQVLVFRAQVEATEGSARAIADRLSPVTVSPELARSVSELEDSEARSALEQLIRRGVAYHNAGLSLEERLLVEDAFRDGHLRVLVSTTTLAMGVNLPADSVVIADHARWDPRNRINRNIDIAEYKNCAGRAGRLGHSERGQSYLLIDEQGFADGVASHYLGGRPEVIESAIPRSRLIEHVLAAIASKIATTREEVHRLFESSFGSRTFYARLGEPDALVSGLNVSLETLSASRLIDIQPSGAVRATTLGEVIGRSGVSVETGSRIIAFLEQLGSAIEEADVIFELCHGEEITRQAPFLRSDERSTNRWKARIAELCEREVDSRLQEVISGGTLPTDVENSALKRCCLALEWKNGTAERSLTARYRAGLGFVHGLGENLAWLLDTTGQLANAMMLSESIRVRLREMAKEMHFGVPFPAVQFARLRVRGLRRAETTRLVRNETGRVFLSLDQVLDAGPNDFAGIINPSLVPQLQETILRSTKESLRRYEAGLLVRARRLSVPEALVRELFATQGTNFERAVENILNSDTLAVGAVRLARQRSGEVDLYIPIPDGGSIVIGATSSIDNAKPISWDKAREILGAVGAPMPIRNYVVLGKPDFHETARRNADEIVQDPSRSILLMPVGIFGELCLEVFELSRTADSLVDLLANRRGYYRPSE